MLRRALAPRGEGALRRRLERDLRRASIEGGLILRYQSRVALTGGAIVAAEALLRWPHPRHGLISPAIFIPIAERTDLVVEIGHYVLSKACREAVRWPVPASRAALRVSANVSPRRPTEGVLIDQVAAALDASGLDPERLEIELAERVMADADLDTLLELAAIRDLGVGLVLDNFGAGGANLAALKKLPLTAVKLDRSLIRTLPENAEDAAIAEATVATAHALGLVVIAEGIETEAQRGLLAGFGCDEGQGFLFGHPEPMAALGTRLLFATGI